MKKSRKVSTILFGYHFDALEGIAEDYECSKSHVLRIALITLEYFLHAEEGGRLTYFHIRDKLTHEDDYK